MMAKAEMQRGEGERLLAAQRRRFWGLVLGLFLAGGLGGFLVGLVSDHQRLGVDTVAATPLLARFALVAVLIGIFSYGTWRFAQQADELEIADNLWGSTAGYYAFAVLFPAWWLLWKMGAAAEPDGWAIFWVAFAVAGAVYLWRKWRAR